MKKIRTVILLFQFVLCVSLLQAQELNSMVTDNYGREKLLGEVNREGLNSNSFKAWFQANYNGYPVNEEAVEASKDLIRDYEITVFLGTWCGDSRREVPRFYKILDAMGFPEEQLKLICVDHVPGAYKKSPGGEEKGLNIIKVPTFIFYKDGKEVNRIVERPVVSLEEDIRKILVSGDYKHRYFRE
ncbi:thiol reductase thioredoxin [Leptobacterium flavescens]|uniref:Thiol reductase thioredoxin n=1 Tax=Leptobacterium flavescens TaxID=472055 RepID=A0A6P0UIP6_9FLAO|nr:thioredoxin family protein [Leptobacterium flavescens]NER13175.1 thiol reductase thioredoxin [Leptobacterium flavescens]